jgi:hypothetical protein
LHATGPGFRPGSRRAALAGGGGGGGCTEDKGAGCAVEGQAGYGIASHDPLLELERYANIAILPSRRFPEVLEKAQQSDG